MPGPGSGWRPRPSTLVGRAVLGRVATDRDDVVARLLRAAGRRIQLRVVESGHHRQAVRAAVERDGRQACGAVGDDELDPDVRRDRDPRERVDRDAGQRAVGDRRVEVGPCLAAAGLAEDDGRAGRDVLHPRLVVGRIGPQDVGDARGEGGDVRAGVDQGGQGRPGPARREVGDARQIDRAEDGRPVEADGRQPVGRCGRERGPVGHDQEVVDRVVDGDQVDRDGRLRRRCQPSIRSSPSVAIRPSP